MICIPESSARSRRRLLRWFLHRGVAHHSRSYVLHYTLPPCGAVYHFSNTCRSLLALNVTPLITADYAAKGRKNASEAESEPLCLLRASLGSKKISTVVCCARRVWVCCEPISTVVRGTFEHFGHSLPWHKVHLAGLVAAVAFLPPPSPICLKKQSPSLLWPFFCPLGTHLHPRLTSVQVAGKDLNRFLLVCSRGCSYCLFVRCTSLSLFPSCSQISPDPLSRTTRC
jgi:hypothetical protein